MCSVSRAITLESPRAVGVDTVKAKEPFAIFIFGAKNNSQGFLDSVVESLTISVYKANRVFR